MQYFCTLFDRNYITRGLALYESLARHCEDFTFYVLCLDRPTLDALTALDLDSVVPLSLQDLEVGDHAFRQARHDRSLVEFYLTSKPVLLSYLFDRAPEAKRMSYLDSDLYFFSDPRAMEEGLTGYSIALTPHRFSARHAGLRTRGEFNAGWVNVRADDEGRNFVQWWRSRCLEWCRLVVEDTRFADQKYLDQVPRLFSNTKIVSNPGANLGPWNIGDVAVEMSGRHVEIAGWPLVFSHFHGARRMLLNLYDTGLHEYGVQLTPAIRNGIYRPYLAELAACERQLEALPRAVRLPLSGNRPSTRIGTLPRELARAARALVRKSAVLAVA